MSRTLPLIAGFATADAVFAWQRANALPVRRFLSDVAALAAALPDRAHVLNVCGDRYRFAVGLAAAIVRDQISLLPPSTHAGTIRQLLARFPDAYCLVESPQPDIDLPQTVYGDALVEPSPDVGFEVPQVPVERTVAHVFTSGSTGAPTLHRKRWGSLVENVRAEADRLGCSGSSAPLALVATVPPQHMYGFESSLLMAWQSGAAIVAERPFYPADVATALARVPGRRMLVTTPFHLRALLAGSETLPAVEQVVCATAPLSLALATEAERRLATRVVEIYGCSETGQLASRRPTLDPRWRLLGDVVLTVDAQGRATAAGGHVEQPTVLADVIELEVDDVADDGKDDGAGDGTDDGADPASSRRFSLIGRTLDLVNIAGRRTSLGHLNVQLNAIDGVVDGVFVMPDDDAAMRDGVTRLAALVVAPSLDAVRLTAALRARIDAVFLPRPIHFVERLPRNGTGKLARASLQAMLASAIATPGADGAASVASSVAASTTPPAAARSPRR